MTRPAAYELTSWNGEKPKRNDWVVAPGATSGELKVAPKKPQPPGVLPNEVVCYVDGIALKPQTNTRESATFQVPPPSDWFALRTLNLCFTDADADTEHELPGLSAPISLVPQGRLTVCRWIFRITVMLLVLTSWRMWHLKVIDQATSLHGAVSALLAFTGFSFSVSFWKPFTDFLDERTSYPKHLASVVVACISALVVVGYGVRSHIRVMHNATEHDIEVAWSEAGAEPLKSGAAEAVWSANFGENVIDAVLGARLKPNDSLRLYCDSNTDLKDCKAFQQIEVAPYQALVSLAPVVSIGCKRRNWPFPGFDGGVMLEPLPESCLPKPTTKWVDDIGGGAQGLFVYREDSSVKGTIERRDWLRARVNSDRRTVVPGQGPIEATSRTVPETIRLSVQATDDDIFREAQLLAKIGEMGQNQFPVPSPQRAYATRFSLGPDKGKAFGTLTCHPRGNDVVVWIIPAVSGSILSAELREQGGQVHSFWESEASEVGASGSPVFSVCLPETATGSALTSGEQEPDELSCPSDQRTDSEEKDRSSEEQDRASPRLELTLTVRELGGILEPTNFSLPAPLRRARIRVIAKGSEAGYELGKLMCCPSRSDSDSASDPVSVLLLDRPGTGARVDLLKPKDSKFVDCAQTASDQLSTLSSWKASPGALTRSQMFQCLQGTALCYAATVTGHSGSERWASDVYLKKFAPRTLPPCILNAREELIKSCDGHSQSAARFWSGLWPTVKRSIKSQGCSLANALVCP